MFMFFDVFELDVVKVDELKVYYCCGGFGDSVVKCVLNEWL